MMQERLVAVKPDIDKDFSMSLASWRWNSERPPQ